MNTYLITYDLNRPGQNYPGLISALQSAGAVRILLSTWLLKTNQSSVQVRDAMQTHVDAGDRLFVTSVNNWAYFNIMNAEAAKKLLPS